MSPRSSKITRLPNDMHQQLDRRLEDGEPEAELLQWLNSLSEERAESGGRLAVEQELSEGRAQQEVLDRARQLAADVAELKQASDEPLTDTLAQFLVAQYVLAAQAALQKTNGNEVDLKTLRTLCVAVAVLRRGDQNAERLRMERERLRLAAQDSETRWKRKIESGLLTLLHAVNRNNPKAKAAFDALLTAIRSPFYFRDGVPWESGATPSPASGEQRQKHPTNPTESNP